MLTYQAIIRMFIMNNRQQATKLLTYYFRLIAQKAGVNWDSDNNAEVEQIIEAIFDEIDESIDSHNNAKVSHSG